MPCIGAPVMPPGIVPVIGIDGSGEDVPAIMGIMAQPAMPLVAVPVIGIDGSGDDVPGIMG